jgi:hypothetical protein
MYVFIIYFHLLNRIVDREVEGNVTGNFILFDLIVIDSLEQSHPEEFLDGICTQADVIRFLAQNTALLRREPLFQRRFAILLFST